MSKVYSKKEQVEKFISDSDVGFFTEHQKDMFALIVSDMEGPTSVSVLLSLIFELAECFESLDALPINEYSMEVLQVSLAVVNYAEMRRMLGK